MDVIANGIVLLDRTTLRFVDVNHSFCKMTGYRRAELLAAEPSDLGLCDAYGGTQQLETLFDGVTDGQAAPVLVRNQPSMLRRKDHSTFNANIRWYPLKEVDAWTLIGVIAPIEATELSSVT